MATEKLISHDPIHLTSKSVYLHLITEIASLNKTQHLSFLPPQWRNRVLKHVQFNSPDQLTCLRNDGKGGDAIDPINKVVC